MNQNEVLVLDISKRFGSVETLLLEIIPLTFIDSRAISRVVRSISTGPEIQLRRRFARNWQIFLPGRVHIECCSHVQGK